MRSCGFMAVLKRVRRAALRCPPTSKSLNIARSFSIQASARSSFPAAKLELFDVSPGSLGARSGSSLFFVCLRLLCTMNIVNSFPSFSELRTTLEQKIVRFVDRSSEGCFGYLRDLEILVATIDHQVHRQVKWLIEENCMKRKLGETKMFNLGKSGRSLNRL